MALLSHSTRKQLLPASGTVNRVLVVRVRFAVGLAENCESGSRWLRQVACRLAVTSVDP
jgi:hypothetical protein